MTTGQVSQETLLTRLKRFVPMTTWLPNYDRSWLRPDILAGITLAAFTIPEAMAYAGLAGLPPQSGLYAGIAAPLIYMLLGTSKQLSIGVTSAVSILVASGLAFAADGDPLQYAQLAAALALMVFVIALIARVLKLGFLVNFISEPVLLGFSSGAALYIASTQLGKLFGIHDCHGEFFERMICIITNLDQTHLPSLILGVSGIVVLLVGERLLPKLPWPLIVVLLSILLISFTGLGEQNIAVAGFIQQGLPSLEFPSLGLVQIRQLLPTAMAVFLLAYVEGMSMARTFATKHDYRIDANQELLALGFVNLGAGLTQAYPVNGSMSRSALSDNIGTKSQLAGGIAALLIAVVVMFFTGIFTNLPEPILAAVVLVAVKGLFRREGLQHLYHVQRKEFWTAIAALFGVLLFGMLEGVLIGVIISLLVLVGRVSQSRLSLLGRVPDRLYLDDIRDHPEYYTVPGLMIIRIDETLFFANAADAGEEINELVVESVENIRVLLLDLEYTEELDYSAVEMLTKLHMTLAQDNIQLKFSRLSPESQAIMERSGLMDLVGIENIHPTTLTAIGHYLKDEDIPIENVKRLTQTFVNRISVIYTTLAERSAESQKGELVRISESLNEMAAKLNLDSEEDEA
jgi:high affinity sulfate transporter 1